MKIYTKTGDTGQTSTLMPGKLSKDAPRIEVIGQVDTLNSSLGLVLTHLPSIQKNLNEDEKTQATAVHEDLLWIQSSLFDIGALLAQDFSKTKTDWISEALKRLETRIDLMTEQLSPLRAFILPGGSQASAFAHNSRSLCRNTERALISFRGTEENFPPLILAYMNRLSDYIFTLARFLNHLAHIEDIKWQAVS